MSSFVIEGGYKLSGEITPQGAKNEALEVICAVLLTPEKVTIHNVPDILDVNNLIQLLRDMQVKVEHPAADTYTFQADNIDLDYAKEHSIYVGRCVGSNSRSVAEHVLSMMFMEAKNLYTSVRDVKHHGWNKPTGREIYGKKLGIIGFGMIGKYLAEYAYGCGMEVYAYDAFAIAEETARQYHAQISTLEDILTDCDYISLHVPLLESTRNMISTEEFKKMKKDACLLNAARGGIVNEEALYEALKKKEIRSACFDVYSSEPPREDDKLLTLDNFLLTPHTAARSMESEQRTCAMSTDIILEQLIGN